MRRTDRLYDLILILRDGKLHRAQDLAKALRVSTRTIYRDMDTLVASGVPVEGERGVGYRMTDTITLPPLNLTGEELEALYLGMAVVSEAGDEDLKKAAQTLSAKIDAVLPDDRNAPRNGWGFAVYPFAEAAKGFAHMPALRAAIRVRQKLEITYCALNDTKTTRIIRPLQMEYWGRIWTVTAWCELSGGFRVFRVDRITNIDVLPQMFIDEIGKTLKDYLANL